jgi:hypothetical protein
VKNLLKNARKLLNSLWTYVVGGLLVFYVLLYALLDLPANLNDIALVNPMRTLLGGLATGLITAQALVFTISLVAAQLNARYTHRMVSRVFTWPTGMYMGLFIGSSIYSMVVLAALSSQPIDFVIQLPLGLKPLHLVTIALALAGTCLVLLVPFLWSFKQRLDPERMAREEGRRAKQHLQKGIHTEPQGVASLDNIVMSAFGYGDYDTFGWGLNELSDVALEAWLLLRATLGESIFRRIAHIGVATIDDPRAPFQVIDALGTVGSALVDQGIQEGARQSAVAMSEIGEEAIRKDHAALIRQAALALSALGSRAADHGLVAVAEEATYSLGHLGGLAARHGMEGSTRQLAAYLRRVGSRAAQERLDLVTRQAMVSLWSLGGSVLRHLPQSAEVVARELEMMERVADSELIDASYLSAPRSEDVENFRLHYMKEIRQVSEDAASDRRGG